MPDAPRNLDQLRQLFAGRRILLTGHTGFKGGWLALWLRRLGADIMGVALPPCDSQPNLFQAIGVESLVAHRIADIRHEQGFLEDVQDFDADLVIHLAAQALVRPSYSAPVETLQTNVVGTAIVLEAARRMPSLCGALMITSDKCYENNEWVWGYREQDPMGGADPYSMSKGCAELVVNAYRRSFFDGPASPILATARAGNVFGGGDWSVDRLIPDIMRAALAGEPVRIRNPRSIRPWQHVLEPLAGYLLLAAGMLAGDRTVAGAWNFGPNADAVVDVETIATGIRDAWGPGAPKLDLGSTGPQPREAAVLRLDSTKAHTLLGWRPALTLDEALALTVAWYRAWHEGKCDMRAFSEVQIDRYLAVLSQGNRPNFDHQREHDEVAACA